MRPLLLKGGRVVDPSQGMDARGDVLLQDGRIGAIGGSITGPDDAEIVDCGGCIVAPGFIDVHCHLREPGREHVETIATGARAARIHPLGRIDDAPALQQERSHQCSPPPFAASASSGRPPARR